MYGVLAIVIVVVAKLTNGEMLRAVAGAAAFFVVATAWTWWRFRRRAEQGRGG
jgi:membrane protein implicated in regulation of membrane protease activity